MPIGRMIRALLAVAGAALVGFHGWLFAAQVAAGRLEDPWLVFRWLAAAALIAAVAAVRRRGESLRGRKGIAIWVLAALLHGPSAAASLESDFRTFALPEAVATTVVQIISSAALGAALWLLAGRRGAGALTPQVRYASAPAVIAAGGLTPRRTRRFAPRPPPLRG
jgi:hypothetical protein